MESDNKYDSNAIKVVFYNEGRGYKLGYVPRYYLSELTLILKKAENYKATIEKLNFETQFRDDDITVVVKVNY
ncbi:MAG: hypothetical protein A2Y24_02465 [Clostridiales bacterium GWE2_32_10]|nr:MAG: hypothetical protein A2Y24_02465 [Clostridiales bacterium GWE2_32_10]HBY20665.1 hypothetical protein [Clostridiales bacterium]